MDYNKYQLILKVNITPSVKTAEAKKEDDFYNRMMILNILHNPLGTTLRVSKLKISGIAITVS